MPLLCSCVQHALQHSHEYTAQSHPKQIRAVNWSTLTHLLYRIASCIVYRSFIRRRNCFVASRARDMLIQSNWIASMCRERPLCCYCERDRMRRRWFSGYVDQLAKWRWLLFAWTRPLSLNRQQVCMLVRLPDLCARRMQFNSSSPSSARYCNVNAVTGHTHTQMVDPNNQKLNIQLNSTEKKETNTRALVSLMRMGSRTSYSHFAFKRRRWRGSALIYLHKKKEKRTE